MPANMMTSVTAMHAMMMMVTKEELPVAMDKIQKKNN